MPTSFFLQFFASSLQCDTGDRPWRSVVRASIASSLRCSVPGVFPLGSPFAGRNACRGGSATAAHFPLQPTRPPASRALHGKPDHRDKARRPGGNPGPGRAISVQLCRRRQRDWGASGRAVSVVVHAAVEIEVAFQPVEQPLRERAAQVAILQGSRFHRALVFGLFEQSDVGIRLD